MLYMQDYSINQEVIRSFQRYFFIPILISIITISLILFFYLDRVEKEYHKEILHRLDKKLQEDILSLSNLLVEWVDYDSPVLYFENQFPDFVKKEFKISVKNLNLQLFVSINKDNSIKEIYLFDREGNYLPIPEGIQNFFKNKMFKHLMKREDSEYGIIALNNEYYMVASRGVLWYKENYKTSHGTLIFGRKIDDIYLKSYENDIGHPIKVLPYYNTRERIIVESKNIFINKGYLLVYSYFQKPIFHFYVELPRKQITTSLIIILIIIFVISSIGILSYFLLRRDIYKKIIQRLIDFKENIIKIKENPDNYTQIEFYKENHDEITEIKKSFNEMLEELKRREELNQLYLELVEKEKEKTYELLLNILPKDIAEKLQNTNEESHIIADEFLEASILFADIVNFSEWSKNLDPRELVNTLNILFTQFDYITDKYKVEKIKTIGDNYMAAAGIPISDVYHADHLILFAIEMIKILHEFNREFGLKIEMRIGINSGKVVAGVIGAKKFIYDVWGDTVNLASRMESSSRKNTIQISEYTYHCIKNEELKKSFIKRGILQLKSGHKIATYLYQNFVMV